MNMYYIPPDAEAQHRLRRASQLEASHDSRYYAVRLQRQIALL